MKYKGRIKKDSENRKNERIRDQSTVKVCGNELCACCPAHIKLIPTHLYLYMFFFQQLVNNRFVILFFVSFLSCHPLTRSEDPVFSLSLPNDCLQNVNLLNLTPSDFTAHGKSFPISVIEKKLSISEK